MELQFKCKLITTKEILNKFRIIFTNQIDQSGLTLPNRDYYINKTDHDEILMAYLDYMTKVFTFIEQIYLHIELLYILCCCCEQVGVLLNSEANPNRTRRHMRDVIEFEIRIAQITVSNAERRDEEKLYHNITIADLHNLAPFVIIKFIKQVIL